MTEKEAEKVEEVLEDPKEPPKSETPEVEEPSVEELQKKIEKLQRSNKNKTEEAKRVHEKLEAFEKAEKEKADADLSEIERLQKQISEKDELILRAEKALKVIQWNEQRREVAKEVGLPDEFALRLEGATREELIEDAKKLADAMPVRKLTNISPTIPGKNATDKPEKNIDELLDFYNL